MLTISETLHPCMSEAERNTYHRDELAPLIGRRAAGDPNAGEELTASIRSRKAAAALGIVRQLEDTDLPRMVDAWNVANGADERKLLAATGEASRVAAAKQAALERAQAECDAATAALDAARGASDKFDAAKRQLNSGDELLQIAWLAFCEVKGVTPRPYKAA